MIIDSHCHLEYEPMSSNLREVIDRAVKNNVKYLLSISTTNESFERIIQIVKNHNNVYGTYGIHPHETKNYQTLTSDEITSSLSNLDFISKSPSVGTGIKSGITVLSPCKQMLCCTRDCRVNF